MRKFLNGLVAFALALLPLAPMPAFAQTSSAIVVSACGTPPSTYGVGQTRQITQDTNGKICDQGGGTVSSNSTIVAPLGSQLSAASVSVVIASDQGAVATKLTPQTSGGLSVFSAIVANNTTSVAVKASAGLLFGVTGYGIAATAPLFVKTYDAAQGSTTCGSGTPKERHMVPAAGGAPGSGFINGAPAVYGVTYATAITYCATTGIADADTTAPTGSTYLLDVYYK